MKEEVSFKMGYDLINYIIKKKLVERTNVGLGSL